MSALLEVRDLRVSFGATEVLDGLDFDVREGEVLAIVGESGSGKSVTALSMIRLLSESAEITSGSLRFEGRDLLALSQEEMRRVRGREITMIFQEPMSSLNPVYTAGFQVAEVLEEHFGQSHKAALEKVRELFEMVGIPAPEERLRSYPHELSGGMRQRVMIAMAMASEPKLLVADEPTTALDVTIQAQILALMKDLRSRFGTSILFITHDMGVVASIADRVLVMYAGQIVEEGSVEALFESPRHPYTQRLLACAPTIGERKERLSVIEGVAPSPDAYPAGCRFHPRCSEAIEKCSAEPPRLVKGVRCWVAQEES